MKIGIMGGTFDPIHNGHLMLGEYAYRQYHLDEVWYMPNGNPPHKSNAAIEAKSRNRVEMVKRAIEGIPYFVLQPYEIENPAIHYSYKTMEHFKEVYPEHEFYFIIGADSLFSLEKWKCPDKLLKTCIILAACREDKDTKDMLSQIEYLNKKYHADIRFLNTPSVEISSTEIREKIKEGISIKGLVPETVLEYLKENQLFEDGENESTEAGKNEKTGSELLR